MCCLFNKININDKKIILFDFIDYENNDLFEM